ncbi:MAG: TonB-dependent receptor [Pseudomonadota bacterium]
MPPSKLLKSLLLTLPVLALPASAEEEYKLDKIEVIGHYANGVGTSDAASQGTVTAKLIENRPIMRPAEILEFVPGVIITQHSGDGKANQYFLRGFNLDHGTDFATSVAGMPVNMRTHAHGQGYSDLNFLIPELVERIDYKKGPYSAEEGNFSSAGAAHIHLFSKLKQGTAEVTAGNNHYQRELLAASKEFGAGTLLYGLELGQNNGPWQNPENFRKWNGVLRWTSGAPDNGYSITAMGYQANWDSTDQIPQRAVESGRINRYGTIDPTDGGDTSRYSLSYESRWKSDNGTTALNAYAIKYNLDLFSNFTYFLDDPINGDQFEQADDRVIFGVNASHAWFSRIGNFDTINKIGIETRRDNIDKVGLYNTVARERIATVREDQVRETSAAIYFENTFTWTNWLRTVAGVRADSYRFDVDSDNPANSGNTRDHITSPKFSVILGPWAKTEYFINAGRGFHSNDARGTTITVDPKTAAPADRVNPLVRSKGTEVGLRTEIIPGLQSSLTLWRLDLDSELLFVGDAGTTEASRPSTRRGIEWNNHYLIKSNLLLDLDLAASRSRFRDSDPGGNYIPGAIDKVASLGLTVTELGPWFGSFQLRYFGPRPLIEDNSERSNATTLAYLRTGYKINKDWKVALDVFNLFDRQASDVDYFYASRLQGEASGGVNDNHFHPVEKRTFRLTITSHF